MQKVFKIPIVKLKNYSERMVFSYVSAKTELQNTYIEGMSCVECKLEKHIYTKGSMHFTYLKKIVFF